MLPDGVKAAFKEHLVYVKRLHQDDLARGYGRVYLPNALAKKYPNADDLHARSQSRGERGEKSFGLYGIIQVCLT